MTYKKLRRSGRISKSVPILLIGSDTEGRVFSEETRTVVLSLHGAGVISTHKLLAEQELVLRWLETNRETEVRVVGEIGSQGEQHTYGVAFVDDSTDFWQMDFPPPPSLAERPLELVLECTACGETVTLLNGDYEFDVCAIHGGLVRYCTECALRDGVEAAGNGSFARGCASKAGAEAAADGTARSEQRVRRRSDLRAGRLGVAAARSFSPRAERSAQAEARGATKASSVAERRAATAALEDRRGRVRAKVNYFACVKSAAFGQDVVMCIDMSRGGLGFRTKNPYLVSTEVTIAVPFSAGVAERAGDFCAGARGKYSRIARTGDVSLRRHVFAGTGSAGASIRKLSGPA